MLPHVFSVCLQRRRRVKHFHLLAASEAQRPESLSTQGGMKSDLEIVTCAYVRRCEHVISCQLSSPKAGEECQGLLQKLDVAKCASQGRVIAAQISWRAGAR